MGLAASALLGMTLLIGALAGHFATEWWQQRQAKAKRRIPSHWPLDPRTMANTEECRVWRWLIRVFFDHFVMIKVPVTRFTFPRKDQDSAYWFELLSGVYCTFTICGPDGQVVGCIDVPGRHGLSRSNQKLKLALLSQCGIPYLVIEPGKLPKLVDIRMDVLGDTAGIENKNELAVTEARQTLRAALDKQRSKRMAGEGAASKSQQVVANGADSSLLSDSGFASSGWQQPNSFIAPLDSRPVQLL
jgi:hypothetical protein